ncbi:NAD-P-binding protein [Mycena polygramma]|nr:NAD-P-binding protein [Mycena polygramma]
MRLLIFGSTGPTGILLVREALTVLDGTTIVLFDMSPSGVISLLTVSRYVRTPEKLPEDLSRNPKCVIVKGQLEDDDALSQAMQGVDIVLSALGPSQFNQPPGTHNPFSRHSIHPLARAYERIIRLMKAHQMNPDRFNLAYYSMVKSVSLSMRNAYKDIRAIGAVIRASELQHWTIIRVRYSATTRYIGDGKTKNHIMLNRIGFAAFVIEEVGKKQWDRKCPLLVSP